MGKDISTEEKLRILNIYSSKPVVAVSGFLAGLVIGLIFILLGLILSLHTKITLASMIKPVILGVFLFGLIGLGAGLLRKIEYVHELNFSLVYVFLGLLLSIFALVAVAILVAQGKAEIIFQQLDFTNVNIISWLVLIISVAFCCFTLANPLQHSWAKFYTLFLPIISDVDYRIIYYNNYFRDQLQVAFYNAKRYQTYFSIMMLYISNFTALKEKHSKNSLVKMQNNFFSAIQKNIRETDVAGLLGEGDVFGIILYATDEQSHIAAERLKNLIRDIDYVKKKKCKLELAYDVLSYSSDLENPEAMLTKAMSSYKKIGSSVQQNRM